MLWTNRVVKGYQVKVVWNDGSVTDKDFSVSDHDNPLTEAKKELRKYADKSNDWHSVSIVKLYAQPGETIKLRMRSS